MCFDKLGMNGQKLIAFLAGWSGFEWNQFIQSGLIRQPSYLL